MYMMQAGIVFRTSNPDVDTKATKTFNTFVSLSALLFEQMGRHIKESSSRTMVTNNPKPVRIQ